MKRSYKVTLVLALILIPLLLLSSGAIGSQDELSAISSSVKDKGAKWVAGETPISKLSPADRKHRLGSLKPLLNTEEKKSAEAELSFLTGLTVPTSFDWRAATGTYVGNYVTPIRDQGNCGSCWAFATTAALESQVLIGSHAPGFDVNLSEQTLVSCGGSGNCGGGYVNYAADFVTNTGLPLETCYPYTATNGTCAKACSGWTNSDYRTIGWHWVATTSPTVAGLKAALYTYGPVVTTMDVYDDFFYYTSGVYSHTSGGYAGGHAVVIVGYSDSGQYFIVKNSWGPGWGEKGFFRIAYSQLNNAVYFGQYTIADEGYDPVNPPPPTCTYSLSRTSRTFHATGGTGKITVTSQSNCSWTAVSNVSWITVTSGSTGSGNGTVKYSVAANPNSTQRTGTLTIGGQTFTVKQRRYGY